MPNLSQPPAIVFSSMIAGLGVIRSLGQAGVPVIALDPNPMAPGLHSRYATRGLVCPDPLRSENGFVDFLLNLGQELGQKGALFPTSDTYVPVLARARRRLEEAFHLPPYDETNVGALTDKRLQGRVLEGAGLPVPRTFYPGSVAEVRALSGKLRYPVVLKPARSRPFFVRYGIKVFLAHGPQAFVHDYEKYSRAGHPMVVQEFIPGGTEVQYSVQFCTNHQAESLAVFEYRKVLKVPPVFGDAVIVQQTDQPEIAELARRAVRALGFRQYMGNAEFKYDATEGRWKFLEVNPRPSICVMLPTVSGINLPFLVYRQLLGQPVPPPHISHKGVAWVRELNSPEVYRYLGAVFLAKWRYLHHTTFAFFSAEDPKPFFYALMVGIQEAKNKLALGRMNG